MVKKSFLASAVLIIFLQGAFILKDAESENRSLPIKTEEKHIKIEVNRVVIGTIVADKMGRIITNLNKKNFEIFEDKKRQNLISLESTDVEISVGIILDVSGSMLYKWSEAAMASMEFIKTANTKDEFLLITFADKPYFNLNFTQDYQELEKKLMLLKPEGSTALLDAIYLGMQAVKKGRYSRKAILIISDGADNHSRYNRKEIIDLVRESDVTIYAIGIFNEDVAEPIHLNSPIDLSATLELERMEVLRGISLLDKITKTSGGGLFKFSVRQSRPGNSSLSDIARHVSLELRNQYILTYRSDNERHDGKWRKVKVKLINLPGNSDFIVRHKEGYYAP